MYKEEFIMLREFFDKLDIATIGALMFYIFTIVDLFVNKGDNMYTYFIISLLFHNMYLLEHNKK